MEYYGHELPRVEHNGHEFLRGYMVFKNSSQFHPNLTSNSTALLPEPLEPSVSSPVSFTTPAPPLLIASITASRFSIVLSFSSNSACIFLSVSSFSAIVASFSCIVDSCLLISSCLSLTVCSSFSTRAFFSSRALVFSSSFFLRTRSFPRVAASSLLSPYSTKMYQ